MTAVLPIGKANPELKLLVIVGDAVQLSVAVGAIQVATAVAAAVDKLTLTGQLAKVGGIASVAHGLPLLAAMTTV